MCSNCGAAAARNARESLARRRRVPVPSARYPFAFAKAFMKSTTASTASIGQEL
jgi:hypothetical protein